MRFATCTAQSRSQILYIDPNHHIFKDFHIFL